jgi:hypothetical protein
MTAIYYVHPQTLSVNIRECYQKYDTALKNLKTDVIEFVKSIKNVENVDFVNAKTEIESKSNGFYLKLSNKYPNRISLYERTSKDVGYLMSNIVVDIKKILVFGMLDLACLPDGINIDMNVGEIAKTIAPKVELMYLEELKQKLEKRCKKYD